MTGQPSRAGADAGNHGRRKGSTTPSRRPVRRPSGLAAPTGHAEDTASETAFALVESGVCAMRLFRSVAKTPDALRPKTEFRMTFLARTLYVRCFSILGPEDLSIFLTLCAVAGLGVKGRINKDRFRVEILNKARTDPPRLRAATPRTSPPPATGARTGLSASPPRPRI